MKRTLRRLSRWTQVGVRKTIVYPACRALLRDTDRDARRALLIAGTARSGTTWLAELIAARVPSRIMFEPFNPHQVSAYSGFGYFQYMRPGAQDPTLRAFCDDVFTGRIRHPWIDRQVDILFPSRRVVKEIRANLMLRWLANQFPQLPILFILRHPCAVVASRLQLGWATDSDIEPMLGQPALVDDFLGDKLDLIRSCRSPAEKHAVIWCVSNLVPLQQFARGTLPVVFYENLVREAETELPRLFRIAGLEYDDSMLSRASRPSATTIGSSAVLTGSDKLGRWKQELSGRQVDDVLRVVEKFGLNDLYGDSIMPHPGRDT